MIALEHKETMQRNCQASITCLQNKEFPSNLQVKGNENSGVPEPKDETDALADGNPAGKHNKNHKTFTHHPDSGLWPPFHLNSFENCFYPFPVDNRYQYAPFNIFSQGYEFHVQEFQYFVVIDFEATCDKERTPYPQEIIEFPSVLVSSVTGQLEACFQTYVRPTCNQLLTDFCKDLTGIQQVQVDRGVTLSEALLRHDKWLEKKGIKNTNFAVVTWSDWDCRVMLESECRFKKIRKPPYFNRWINLKVPFREVFGAVRCNLKEAVQLAGLTWQGRAHCGLDDAKNTARLLALLMRSGFKFSITNSLMWPPTDCPITLKQTPECPSFSNHHPPLKPKDMQVPVFQSYPYCHCGVKSSKGIVQKPGPTQGNFFFGCGNWTAATGARCHYFQWASS